MSRYLALDVGERRTGIAFCDEVSNVPVALDTIEHTTIDVLIEHVADLAERRGVDSIVVGLPFLPSGSEGAQCIFSRTVGSHLAKEGFLIDYCDERYTTPREPEISDGNAAAACQILLTYLEIKRHSSN